MSPQLLKTNARFFKTSAEDPFCRGILGRLARILAIKDYVQDILKNLGCFEEIGAAEMHLMVYFAFAEE